MSAPDEHAAIRREVTRQAWPVVLQMLLKTLMFYVDTYMISGVGAAAMAAMGVVGPISHTLVAILSALFWRHELSWVIYASVALMWLVPDKRIERVL